MPSVTGIIRSSTGTPLGAQVVRFVETQASPASGVYVTRPDIGEAVTFADGSFTLNVEGGTYAVNIGGFTVTQITVPASGGPYTVSGLIDSGLTSITLPVSLYGILQGTGSTIAAITGTADRFPLWGSSSPYLSASSSLSQDTVSSVAKITANQAHLGFAEIPAPTSGPAAAVVATAGNLNGAYTYKVAFVNAIGQTELSPASSSVSPSNEQVFLSSIETGPTGTTKRKIYRTLAGGTYYLNLATINDNTTTSYTDNIADSSLEDLTDAAHAGLGQFPGEARNNQNNTTGGYLMVAETVAGYLGNNTTTYGRGAGAALLSFVTDAYGYENSFFGVDAGKSCLSHLNSGFGFKALYSLTSGFPITAFGGLCLYSLTTGDTDTGFGYRVFYSLQTGVGNTGAGYRAGHEATDCDYVTIFGFSTAYNNQADSVNGFGALTLYENTTGTNNCAFGTEALRYNTTTSGLSAFGNNAGRSPTGCSNGVYLGYNTTSGNNLTNFAAIGYNVTVSASNTITLGNGVNVGINQSTPRAGLDLVASQTGADSGSAPTGGFLLASGSTTGALSMGLDPSGSFYAWIQARNTGTTDKYPLALNPTGGSVGVGMTAPNLGSYTRALTVRGGTSGDATVAMELQGSRTVDGDFALLDFRHQANLVASVAAYRDTADNRGGLKFYVNAGSGLATAIQITSGRTINIPTLTASQFVVTDASSNLTTMGTGTANYLPKWTGGSPFLSGTSSIHDDGSVHIYGTTTLGSYTKAVSVTAGTSGDSTMGLALQGSRTTTGDFSVVDGYHKTTSVAALAFYRDGADDAGGVKLYRRASGGSLQVGIGVSSAGVVNVPGLTASRFVVTDGSSNLSTQAGVSLTAEVTGVLPIGNGGTNASSFSTSGGFTYYNGTRLVTTSALTLAASTPTASIMDIAQIFRISGNIDIATISGSVILGGVIEATSGSALGFFGVTPATRASAYTQTYSTATRTHAAVTSANLATTAATNSSPWGFATQAQADAIATQVNATQADLLNLKQLVNSIVDDLQAYGLFQ